MCDSERIICSHKITVVDRVNSPKEVPIISLKQYLMGGGYGERRVCCYLRREGRGEVRFSKRCSLSQAEERKENGEICLKKKLAAPGDGNNESVYRVNSESLGLLGNFFQPLNHQEHHEHREPAGRSENNPSGRDG